MVDPLCKQVFLGKPRDLARTQHPGAAEFRARAQRYERGKTQSGWVNLSYWNQWAWWNQWYAQSLLGFFSGAWTVWLLMIFGWFQILADGNFGHGWSWPTNFPSTKSAPPLNLTHIHSPFHRFATNLSQNWMMGQRKSGNPYISSLKLS